MDPEIVQYQNAQWLEPSNTRSRKAPIERFHFVKRSMTRKAIMHPNRRVSMQCMQGQDGKFYYIPLDAYNTDHLQIISEFSPLLVNPTPAQFEPGAMYTYIVASIIRKDPVTTMDIQVVPAKLYATKAMNMFEFGTKHHQIFYRMASTDELDRVARTAGIPMDELQYGLHASGEIHCITPTSLQFNFYSGTYKMKRAIPKRREKYEMGLITRLMQTIDQAYTPDFKFTPFIVQEALPITQDQIAHLKRKEIPAFGFDTQAQCRTMRMNVLRHKNIEKMDMSHEKMHEMYKNITNPPVPVPFASAFAASSASSASRPSMPLHALSLPELRSRATELKLPFQPEHDRMTIIKMIQQSTTGKSGGKKRTVKRRTRR
jgi:hypothetical protein